MNITPQQKRAVKNIDTAKILVEQLNDKLSQHEEEISNLRLNYASTQDKYEKMVEKYHNADTLSKVLESKSETLLIIESIKVIISGGLFGWGFLLLGQKNNLGLLIIAGAVIAYCLALLLQKIIATKRTRNRIS